MVEPFCYYPVDCCMKGDELFWLPCGCSPLEDVKNGDLKVLSPPLVPPDFKNGLEFFYPALRKGLEVGLASFCSWSGFGFEVNYAVDALACPSLPIKNGDLTPDCSAVAFCFDLDFTVSSWGASGYSYSFFCFELSTLLPFVDVDFSEGACCYYSFVSSSVAWSVTRLDSVDRKFSSSVALSGIVSREIRSFFCFATGDEDCRCFASSSETFFKSEDFWLWRPADGT